MPIPGTRQTKAWFFIPVTPAVRLNTYNLPNQTTYQNLVSSAAFILNSEDSADAAQTQQGLVLKSIAADILAAIDTKDIGFGALALSVSPMQLPTVVLTGGTVAVTQNKGTGALIYTIPPYLLASDGDVSITSPSGGQALIYNSGASKWENSSIFYQAIWSNLTPVATEPAINFSTTFTVTDDTVHHCSTITITTNGITYSLMQQTSGGAVLLGNSTGSAGNISEQTVGTGLTLSGGSLTITVNGITYTKLQQASTGFVLLGNPTGSAANYKEVAISSALVFTGGTTLDLASNGITYAQMQQTSGNNVLLGNATGSPANISEIAVQGLQLSSGILSANTLKVATASTYTVLASDFNGVVLGFTYPATGVVTVTMCNPSLVPIGVRILFKDLSGNAGSNHITVQPYSGETFDGSASLSITANYGKGALFTDGVNWFTL